MFSSSVFFAYLYAALVAATVSPSPAPSPSVRASASAPLSDADRLRAKVDDARGKQPDAERVIESFAESGRITKRTLVEIGHDYRVTDEDGPFTTMYGRFADQRWHQNENGQTVLDQPRNGAEASERRSESVQHVTSPIVADVIVNVNPKGFGTKTYVDPATLHVVRIERVTATGTGVTTYDDFRKTQGYVRAWHYHYSDGQNANELDEHIVAIDGDASKANVAIPRPRREVVLFPPGVTSAKLPATIDENDHFVVRVQVGSRGLDFLVDTGASGIILDAATARSLGLTLYTEGSSAANAGRSVESEAIVPKMSVGPLEMNDVAVSVIPSLQFDAGERTRVVGLLGFDFIASLALTFDYEKGTLTATDYDAFTAPEGKNTFAVPIRVGDQGPEADLTLDGHLGEGFQVDTGGVGGVLINDVFTRKYPGITRGFTGGAQTIQLSGVGGGFATTVYKVPMMELGPLRFRDFTALVVRSDRVYASDHYDGVIGPELLQLFTMTTDYADSTLYFTLNGRGLHAKD